MLGLTVNPLSFPPALKLNCINTTGVPLSSRNSFTRSKNKILHGAGSFIQTYIVKLFLGLVIMFLFRLFSSPTSASSLDLQVTQNNLYKIFSVFFHPTLINYFLFEIEFYSVLSPLDCVSKVTLRFYLSCKHAASFPSPCRVNHSIDFYN